MDLNRHSLEIEILVLTIRYLVTQKFPLGSLGTRADGGVLFVYLNGDSRLVVCDFHVLGSCARVCKLFVGTVELSTCRALFFSVFHSARM